MDKNRTYGKRARGLYRALIVLCALALGIAGVVFYLNTEGEGGGSATQNGDAGPATVGIDPDSIANGIHVQTGLLVADGYQDVVENCTQCHSASLVIQNRMDAKGWEATIRWMQSTQNLWALGDKKDRIINYLVTNYPVEKKGRRAPLKDIEWYHLNP